MEKITAKIKREYQSRPAHSRCHVDEAPNGQYILIHEATGQKCRCYYHETSREWELIPV